MSETEETDESPRAQTIKELALMAEDCRRCPLHEPATQVVFGEGPANARMVFIGEQPGDKEDIAGRPFVGPAGRLFDEALKEADIARGEAYVTNAVKHFKFEDRGKFRLHKKPDASEVKACKWWLAEEFRLIGPELAVTLGATAAGALLGRTVRVTQERGKILTTDKGGRVVATVHPSYLLRIRDADKAAEEREKFIEDLRFAKAQLG